MPQKLIRLTSKPQADRPDGTTGEPPSAGECVFTGLFNEDLEIKQNSEVALQSLSVERKSQEIRIKRSNNTLNFASVNSDPDPGDPAGSNQQSTILPLDTYNKSNDTELLQSITNGLNKVCNMLNVPEQMNIQWDCVVNTDGHAKITAGVSPFYSIDQGHPAQGSTDPVPSFPTFCVPDESVLNSVPGAEAVLTGTHDGAQGICRESDTAISPPNPAESYIYSIVPFIKSTGSIRVRLKRLLASGGQISAYIGLVKGETGLSKLTNSTLEESDMEYAIRVNGNNNPMDFKKSAADAFATTAVTPINHTVAGADYNDVLEIVVGGDKLTGQIHQNNAVGGAGTDIKTALASANLEEGENYYWFISFVEGKDKVVFDLCSCSLDPFYYEVGIEKESLDPNNQALKTNTTVLSTVVEYNRDTELTPVFSANEAVINFLGWPSSYLIGPNKELKNVEITPKAQAYDGNGVGEYALTLGFGWVAPEPFDNNYEADNYIIDTQSFLLDSYDSYGISNQERSALSGGSRRNILATLPISEEPIAGTANGIIQYQPNTLNFIRIRNRSDIITRQLRFRLLTGRYKDVPIQNMAALTLLIRDPEGYEE